MKEAAGSSVVRVATLNLWGWHGAWDERRSVLVDGLRELRPDVIALQEAVVTDGYDQVADLLDAGYHVAHQASREADGTGLSIACRWPLGEVPSEHVGRIAVAEILAPDPLGTLLFAHHNPSWQLGFEHEREQQAVAAARFVEELVGQRDVNHVVLAGDFKPPPTLLACASGGVCSPWVTSAYATGTPGRAPTPGIPDTRSRRATRS